MKSVNLKIPEWMFFRWIYMRIFLKKENWWSGIFLSTLDKYNGKNSNTASESFDIS